MTRAALAACALAVLAGRAEALSEPAFTYDRRLGIAAGAALARAAADGAPRPGVRVLRTYVRCYRDRGAFERSFERRFRLPARRVLAYYAHGSDVHLRRGTCASARAFLDGRLGLFTAGAFAVLLHEALHRQGLRHERLTTCFANEAVRWGALWARYPERRALRARNLAFAYTRRFTPPSYAMGRPICLALARRTSWAPAAAARR